jgi:hypothetical protein
MGAKRFNLSDFTSEMLCQVLIIKVFVNIHDFCSFFYKNIHKMYFGRLSREQIPNLTFAPLTN